MDDTVPSQPDTKPPRTWKSELPFLAIGLVAVGFPLLGINPILPMVEAWPPEVMDFVQNNLPAYVAACLAVAVAAVSMTAIMVKRHLVLVTALATFSVATGLLADWKIGRDWETRQTWVLEADRLADDLLKLEGLRGKELHDAARAQGREITVGIFGEWAVGPGWWQGKTRAPVAATSEAGEPR